MPAPAIPVHSMAEASLYLMLVRCEACSGSAMPTSAQAVDGQAGAVEDGSALCVAVTCRACGCERTVRFDLGRVDPAEAAGGLEGWAAMAQVGQAPPVNRTDQPSQALDAADWLALHTMLSATARSKLEQAASSADRIAARKSQIQAGECIEEMLKLYDADNELPPADAFFSQSNRNRFREHPELFLRERLLSLRSRSARARAHENGQ